MMKVLLVIAFLSFYSFMPVIAQEAMDTAYLYFDTSSNLTCVAEVEETSNNNGKAEIRKYEKTINGNTISFYVCLEKFNFNTKKDSIDTLDTSYLQRIKFSEIDSMIRVVDKREESIPFSYLGPDSAFEEIYIIEKINDKQVVKYNVYWQYYIE